MKKILGLTSAFLLLGLTSLGAQALTITVDDIDRYLVDINGDSNTVCTTYASPGSTTDLCQASTDNGKNDAVAFDILDGLNLAYKDEEDGEKGGLAGSYETNLTFPDPGTDMTIDYISGPSMSCGTGSECWLVMKDGDVDPARYLFNLTLIGWNGTDDIVLTNFFGGKDISHAALYTASPVPVPAAVWLFGTALLGFIGISRRTKV